MATKYTLAGQTYTMSRQLKARLLELVDLHEDNVIGVRSGSDAKKVYHVEHNGDVSTYCNCPARIEDCAHRIAVDSHLEQSREEELAGAQVVAAAVIPELAEDLVQHLEDDEPSMGDIAEQIIAEELARKAEQDRKIRAGIEEDLLAELAQYEREVATAPAYVPEALESVEDIDSGMMDMIDAMQAEKARKLAAQAAYREAWPDDFSYYYGAA